MDPERRAELREAFSSCDPDDAGTVEVHVLLRRLKRIAEWDLVDALRQVMQTQQRNITLAQLMRLAGSDAEDLAVSETTSEHDLGGRGLRMMAVDSDDSDYRQAAAPPVHRRNLSARVTRVQSRSDAKPAGHRRAQSTPTGGVPTPLVGARRRSSREMRIDEEDERDAKLAEEKSRQQPVVVAVAVPAEASPERGRRGAEDTSAGPAPPPPSAPREDADAHETSDEARKQRHHRSPSPFKWFRGKMSRSKSEADDVKESQRRREADDVDLSAPPLHRATSYDHGARGTGEAKPTSRERHAPSLGLKLTSEEEDDDEDVRRQAHFRSRSMDPAAARKPPKTPGRGDASGEHRRGAQSMSYGASSGGSARPQQSSGVALETDSDRARSRFEHTPSRRESPGHRQTPSASGLSVRSRERSQPSSHASSHLPDRAVDTPDDVRDPIAGRLRLHGEVGDALEAMMAEEFRRGHIGEQDVHLLRTHAPQNTGGKLRILWESMLDKKGTNSLVLGFHHRYVVLFGRRLDAEAEMRWYRKKVESAWGPLPIEERGSIPLSRIEAVEPILKGKAQRSFLVRLKPEHAGAKDEDAADDTDAMEDFENYAEGNSSDGRPSPRSHGKGMVRTHSQQGNHAPAFTFRAATGLQAKLWIVVLKGFIEEHRAAQEPA